MATNRNGIPANVVITNEHSDAASAITTVDTAHQFTGLTPATPSNAMQSNPPMAVASIALQNPLHLRQQQQIQQQLHIQQQQCHVQPNQNRAVHCINLSSIRHNYGEVQSSAARQQCQVIVVVKADGYGHGATLTACHLVERCGASAFAVATLEEGIALRRAFEEKFPSSPRVRIVVLGAPVGYPHCFDAYLHNGIELTVSGPEVAASLARWMTDHDGRRRAEVARVAERTKEELMDNHLLGDHRNPMRNGVVRQISKGAGQKNEELLRKDTERLSKGGKAPVSPTKNDGRETSTCNTTLSSNDALNSEEDCDDGGEEERNDNSNDNDNNNNPRPVSPSKLQRKHNAATLTNVTGDDLAREVRQILVGQRHATAKAAQAAAEGKLMATIPEPPVEECIGGHVVSATGSGDAEKKVEPKVDIVATLNPGANAKMTDAGSFFCGIDDAARASRQQELREVRMSQLNNDGDNTADAIQTDAGDGSEPPPIRKKLRWHALVDSGMGRLGFKTESDESCGDSDSSVSSGSGHSRSRDTVSVIKQLYDAEVHEGAPIEFYGMCTHMADANSTSTYTNNQMERFRGLLHRVRSAGIAVPTVSTDNSAALLTPSLTHFDPNSILAHDTRGYVRCGGAIYGQRPAFLQLRAVSTLSATVKHVAIIKQGESVGYDRAYVAPRDVRIATLTVGFADGYPRELGNGVGKVSIRGRTFLVAGNVCMDMLMVDLGPADGAVGVGSSVAVGDTAVLWGPEEASVEECGDGLVPLAELAATLKTTQSALTCGLDKLRVQRHLVG